MNRTPALLGGALVVGLVALVAYRIGQSQHGASREAPDSSASAAPAAQARGGWESVALPSPAVLRAISSGADTSFVVGDKGTIFRRANGDATWAPETSGTDRTLNAVAQRGDEAFAAGGGVIAERGRDAWSVTRDLPVFRGAAYSWMGPIAVGDGGALYVKGPSGWSAHALATKADLRGVCAGLTETLVVGAGGVVLRWTMGEWKREPVVTTEDLEAIACDDKHAVAVGASGTVIERKNDAWSVVRTAGPHLYGVAATFGMASWLAVGEKGTAVRSLGSEPTAITSDLFGVAEGPQGELAVGPGGLYSRKN